MLPASKFQLLALLSVAMLLWLLPGGVTSFPARAQAPAPHGDAQRVVELARMGGLATGAVPLPDGSLLIAEGASLLHLSPEYPPIILDRTDLGHGNILDIVRSGSAILVLSENGLLSFAIPDGAIQAPVSFTPGGGQSLAAEGDIVLIAAREAGLRVVGLSPEGLLTPLAVFSFTGPGGGPAAALDVALSMEGSRAYIAAGSAGLHVVDLSDPTAPRSVDYLPEIAPAASVTKVGALLAVASQGRVLAVDPATGQMIGLYAPLREGRRISVQEDFAYIADSADGLKILYLAAPDRPVQVYGEADRPAYDIWLDGDILYLAAADGLRILDASSRYRPEELSLLALPGLPQGITADPDTGRVFVALGDEGVAVVDALNFASPRITRLIKLAGPAYAVHFDGRTLYAAIGQAGLAVIDAPPGGETLLATFALPGTAYDLDRRGDALYVAAGDAGLLSVDVARPSAPVLAAVLPLEPVRASEMAPAEALSVTISGKRAYVSYAEGFIVADVSRADRIARLTRIAAPAAQVAVSDVYLYALSETRLTIFDARASAEPVRLRTYTAPSALGDLAAQDDTIFAAHASPGPDIVVVSFAAPDYPVETDNEGEAGQTIRAIPVGAEVWLAAGFAGLRRYEITEGGALIPRGGYAALADASSLTLHDGSLLAAGRSGWVMLARADDGSLNYQTGSPDALPVLDVAVEGDRAAVAAGEQGVALYDLTDPAAPILMAQRETHGPAVAVSLDPSFVYIADAGGLLMFDRRYLQPVARIATPAPATDLIRHGDFAYLSLADGSLAVIALADPTQALVVRRAIRTERPYDLVSPGGIDLLYGVADNRIVRLRTDDLDRLGILNDSTLPVLPTDSFFAGNLLATFAPDGALRYYDVSSLELGVAWRGTTRLVNPEASVSDLVLADGFAYVALGDEGLAVIDLTAPDRRTTVYTDPVYALHRDTIRTDRLLAAGYSVALWDISAPGAPILLDTLPLTGPARRVDPASAWASTFLVSLENGLSIVTWDPNAASLAESGRWYGPPVDRSLQLGARAYLALHQGGLLALDLRDIAHPAPLFAYTSPYGQFVHDLIPAADLTFLASWDGGIEVLYAQEAAPVPHLRSILQTGSPRALSLSLSPEGEYAVAALGEEGVQIYDLFDPSNPSLVGSVDTPGAALAAATSGSALFIAEGQCGLRIFDVAMLQETGYWRGGYASTLALSGDVLYLGGGSQLVALRYDPSLPGALPPTPQLPDPADGAGDIPLDTDLGWSPQPDPCDSLLYEVFLNVGGEQVLAAQVAGRTSLTVGPLIPAQTYTWHVEVSDRQGDRTSGPEWHFTTMTGVYPDAVPPAPPVFVEQIRQHPAVPFSLVGMFITIAILTTLYWRTRRSTAPEELPLDTPDWYATDGEDILEEGS